MNDAAGACERPAGVALVTTTARGGRAAGGGHGARTRDVTRLRCHARCLRRLGVMAVSFRALCASVRSSIDVRTGAILNEPPYDRRRPDRVCV